MSSDNFALHPQLAADTLIVGDLPLCRVLLMNNRHFPWLILVPRRTRSSSEAVAHNDLRELHDLNDADYTTAMNEVRKTAQSFATLTQAYKMNIAALGNMVPQLHIHIIARQKNDAAWPNPVWNAGVKTEPYLQNECDALIAKTRAALGLS